PHDRPELLAQGEVVSEPDRGHARSERRMVGDRADRLAVDEHPRPIALERLPVVAPGHQHGGLLLDGTRKGSRSSRDSAMRSILLVTLGSPRAPTTDAVRDYLAQFLSDPLVVELPRLLWLPILHGIVLRTRPARSAEKYRLVWTPEGSPLAVHTAR